MAILSEFYKPLLCLKIIFLCNVAAIAKPDSQVEVRAVFIKCEQDERQELSSDNEVSRFEREELYKHSALRGCSKKIAVTVKLASQPNMEPGDEFIPIEHVLQGSRRVRLLDPYVMRLRRELPLQAYKLKKIDTVSGILNYNEYTINKRQQRSSDISTREPQIVYLNSSFSSLHNLEHATVTSSMQKQIFRNHDFPPTYSSISDTMKCSNKRNKRSEPNVMIENEPTMLQIITEKSKDQRGETSGLDQLKHPYTEKLDHLERNVAKYMDSDTNVGHGNQAIVNPDQSTRSNDEYRIDKTKVRNIQKPNRQRDEQEDKIRTKKNDRTMRNFNFEKPLTVYEINNPDVWLTVHIQLFEKLSTPEGKTLWNDLSKGDRASVSSLSPEWSDQDLNVRYRAEWIPKENFSFPFPQMSLLMPKDTNLDDTKDAVKRNLDLFKSGDYIIVPKEDIVTLDSSKIVAKKNLENYSDEQQPANQLRRVMVRMSRALVDSKTKKLNITAHKGDQYLTMPYGGIHQAQIDLEARADENQLVNAGSFGRIMTIVSDNTRRTQTIMNVQIMNTGLMAACFSVKPRDCGPELQSNDDENGTDNAKDDLVLVPPRHTRYVRIVLPNEIPSDSTRCTVSLLNDGGNSVAVREVTIKRGDRCYCVWHCECVCLSDDPKLICEEMPDARQVAAGLSLRGRPRHARSVCYHDVPSLNMIVIFFGVLIVLFILGFIKAVLGLICPSVGSCGMARIIEMPRQLSQYYEKSIESIPVEYDDECWPIHPITKKRTVRLISKYHYDGKSMPILFSSVFLVRSMEFLLNLVFFIILPCRLVYDIIKQMCTCVRKAKTQKTDRVQMQYESDTRSRTPQDMQESSRLRRRRRRQITRLRRWMTNEAEDLSTCLWQKSHPVEQSSTNTSMRPLILEDFGTMNKKPPNSDEDDTEFVLTQMKKSRESLAKSHKTQNTGGKLQQPTRPNK